MEADFFFIFRMNNILDKQLEFSDFFLTLPWLSEPQKRGNILTFEEQGYALLSAVGMSAETEYSSCMSVLQVGKWCRGRILLRPDPCALGTFL